MYADGARRVRLKQVAGHALQLPVELLQRLRCHTRTHYGSQSDASASVSD